MAAPDIAPSVVFLLGSLEKYFLTLELPAQHDIDADADLEIVVGADSQANELWWWENRDRTLPHVARVAPHLATGQVIPRAVSRGCLRVGDHTFMVLSHELPNEAVKAI